jgi:hypothetical protein
MNSTEWNKADRFELELHSPVNPLRNGVDGLGEVLDVIESIDPELRPDKLSVIKRRMKYSRQALRKHIDKATGVDGDTRFLLFRSRPPDAYCWISCFEENENARFSLEFRVNPFDWFREPGKEAERAARCLDIVRALAARLPLSYGYAHSYIDYYLGPERSLLYKKFVPEQAIGTYWLNVYGSRLVEAIGRERVLSTPAALVEELPHGAVLFLTRPTPADFDSEEARLAQARALVHLRPDLKLEDTLATLRQRSLHFVPVPIQFHPDVAEILLEEVRFHGLSRQREMVEKFNAYRPPPVTEWLPADQQLWPDVGGPEKVREYLDAIERSFIQILQSPLRKEAPAIKARAPEALPHMDWEVWRMGWGRKNTDPWTRDALFKGLGAYLGVMLVRELGGRWVPRLNLEESAVVVGDRAWLPFLRARHALEGKDAPLDSSMTQLFREARRIHGAAPSPMKSPASP